MATLFKACLVDGCNGDASRIARGSCGYCGPHYYRFRKHGDPLAGRTITGEPSRYIDEIAMKHEGDECLIWPFATSGVGYAAVWIDGRQQRVHRYICERTHGAPPTPEHEAAHSCGRGDDACVNPYHLSWKTASENALDRIGHDTHKRGDRSHFAILTEHQARQILGLKGKLPQKDIASHFGVSKSAVGMIHCGRTWSWLAD